MALGKNYIGLWKTMTLSFTNHKMRRLELINENMCFGNNAVFPMERRLLGSNNTCHWSSGNKTSTFGKQ